MEIFQNKEGGFGEVKKNLLIKQIPVLLIAVLGGVGMSYFSSSHGPDDINVYPFVIVVCLGAAAFGFSRGLKTQKKNYESYTLTMGNNHVVREQSNTPPITLAFNDITTITKNMNGGFTIKGGSAMNTIVVSAQIEGYEKLERMLNEVKPITVQTSKTLLQRYAMVLPLVVIGLMAGVYVSYNKIIVAICGLSILALLGYSFYKIQTNSNIDYRTKKRMWWVIAVGISIVVGMYYKLVVL